MKIIKIADKFIADSTISNQFKFFTNVKDKIGIEWANPPYSSQPSTIHDENGKPLRNYKKGISGRIKNSKINKADFDIYINFICKVDAEILEERACIVEIKAHATNTEIAKWILPKDLLPSFYSILHDKLGCSGSNLETPLKVFEKIQKENEAQKNKQEIIAAKTTYNGEDVYYYHRLTRIRTNAYQASEMSMYIRISTSALSQQKTYSVCFDIKYLESGEQSTKIIESHPTMEKAIVQIDEYVNAAKVQKDYRGPSSSLYIPVGANQDNWNFILNTWKTPGRKPVAEPVVNPVVEQNKTAEPSPSTPASIDPIAPTDPTAPSTVAPQVPSKRRKPPIGLHKLFGQAQDFGGYFSGEVPDYAGGLIGTPSVDASQISGLFGGTNEAINLVNNYTSDALKNVAYIFNFSKGGAYGVYIPALDRAIKTKALKHQLEQKGYKIAEENGLLTAHPTKEEIPPENIDKDIDQLWNQLNSSGGSALGINMSDVIEATSQNANTIMSSIRSQVPDIPSQVEAILKEVLGVYHLAAIILHEASHAKGGDEGKAQSDEQSFRSWAQGNLNKQYKSKLEGAGLEEFYSPLELGTEVLHAATNNWYKTAQFSGRLNYNPSSSGSGNKADGSDISGRHKGSWKSEGFAEWAMLIQQDQSIPIEQRLNRRDLGHLEKDIDPEHNIIEEQLRKQFRNDFKPNVQLITEELLAPDRDESQGYKALETLLEERRPRPLMTPLAKAASLTKESRVENSTFGWYNNLDISDGSTIPGLSDRVMAWDDRDESFAAEEDTIRSQSRYNPEYDLKGFYFRWVEPRYKPELFDDISRDYSNTSPARRFAGKIDTTITQMLSIIKSIDEEMVNEKIKATRLVVSEDLIDLLNKLLNREGLRVKAYRVEKMENIFAIWIFGNTVPEDSIDKAEQYFQNVDGSEKFKDMVEDLLNCKEIITSAVSDVINTAKDICKEYGVDDLYLIGEYARKKYEGESKPFVSELNFSCSSIDAGLKIGSMLSNKLNVVNEHVIMGKYGMSFPYKGVRILFSRSPYFKEVGENMKENRYDYSNSILRDICNKDFTANMMIYDIIDNKVLDPIGVRSDVKNKIVKTLFNPKFIVESNPMVIMRAISFKLDGYSIDKELERAMIEGGPSLNAGRFSKERIKFAKEYLKSKGTNGKEEVESLFEEYGLNEEIEKSEESEKEI